jgi:membrane protease YdiL (CAAX protease family)
MDETNRLPKNDKIKECHLDNVSSGKKWRILTILSLSIVISHAPIIIGCLVFIEGDFIDKNIVLLKLLRIVSMLLMIAFAVGIWRITIIPRISMQWIGGKKSSTILGVIALPFILKASDVILRQIFSTLGIYVSDIVIQRQDSIALFIAEMILVVLATPIVEEIFWRGYVQGVLERIISKPIAVFIQAFLFALIHMDSGAVGSGRLYH